MKLPRTIVQVAEAPYAPEVRLTIVHIGIQTVRKSEAVEVGVWCRSCRGCWRRWRGCRRAGSAARICRIIANLKSNSYFYDFAF